MVKLIPGVATFSEMVSIQQQIYKIYLDLPLNFHTSIFLLLLFYCGLYEAK